MGAMCNSEKGLYYLNYVKLIAEQRSRRSPLSKYHIKETVFHRSPNCVVIVVVFTEISGISCRRQLG